MVCWHFKDSSLISSAVFGTAGPLCCFRLTVYCPNGPVCVLTPSLYCYIIAFVMTLICFALMMRLKYHPGQFSVFYLPSIRDGAGQVKLGKHFNLG